MGEFYNRGGNIIPKSSRGITGGKFYEPLALENGENNPISADSISDLFNSEKISEFASSLGITKRVQKRLYLKFMPQFMDTISNSEKILE